MSMGMGSDADDHSDVMDLTRNIMMVSVIALFILVIFLIIVHLYSRWYWYRRGRQTAMADRQPQGGLDASFLKIIEFHAKDFEHGVECAICLLELEEGDKARILPKCHHGFHMECIDMWFHSHSTCPICRDHISQQQSHSHSPTDDDAALVNDNHHHHHHQEEPSSSSSSLRDTGIRPDLVIDIAAAQEEEEEEQVSSSTRCSSGIRSFKRIFSPGSSSNPKSCPLTP